MNKKTEHLNHLRVLTGIHCINTLNCEIVQDRNVLLV